MLRKDIVVSVPRDLISQAHLENCNRTPAVPPQSTSPGISQISPLVSPCPMAVFHPPTRTDTLCSTTGYALPEDQGGCPRTLSTVSVPLNPNLRVVPRAATEHHLPPTMSSGISQIRPLVSPCPMAVSHSPTQVDMPC